MSKFEQDQKLLQLYYEQYYPFNTVFRFINGPKNLGRNRDIAIFIPTANDAQICVRPISIDSEINLEHRITKRSVFPYRLDAGACYHSPLEGNDHDPSIMPIIAYRELVFDIDINDYDEVRTCCVGKNLCSMCWIFVYLAARFITCVVSQHFGLGTTQCVYSGGRGLHIYADSIKAGEMNSSMRSAIISYMALYSKLERNETIGHKLWKDAIEIFEPKVAQLLIDQRFFANSQLAINFQKLLPQQLRSKLTTSLRNANARNLADNSLNPQNQWNLFYKDAGKEIAERLIIWFCVPRIDSKVTIDPKHLLKLPFSVHPGTKNISVPLTLEQVARFDPSKAINLRTILIDPETFRKELQCYC